MPTCQGRPIRAAKERAKELKVWQRDLTPPPAESPPPTTRKRRSSTSGDTSRKRKSRTKKRRKAVHVPDKGDEVNSMAIDQPADTEDSPYAPANLDVESGYDEPPFTQKPQYRRDSPAQGHEGDRSPLHNNGSVLPDMDDEIEGDEDLAPVEKGGVDELEEDELGDEMEGVEDELDEGFDTEIPNWAIMDQEPTITSGQPSTRVDEDIDLGLGSASDSDSGSDSESDSESNASLGGDATTDNLVGENRDDAVGLSLENRKGKAKANPPKSDADDSELDSSGCEDVFFLQAPKLHKAIPPTPGSGKSQRGNDTLGHRSGNVATREETRAASTRTTKSSVPHPADTSSNKKKLSTTDTDQSRPRPVPRPVGPAGKTQPAATKATMVKPTVAVTEATVTKAAATKAGPVKAGHHAKPPKPKAKGPTQPEQPNPPAPKVTSKRVAQHEAEAPVWKDNTVPQPDPNHTTKTRRKTKEADEESGDHQEWDSITELKLTGGSFKVSEQNSVIKNVIKAAIHAGFVLALTEDAWPEYTSRASFVQALLKLGVAAVGEQANPIVARLEGEEGYIVYFTEKVMTRFALDRGTVKEYAESIVTQTLQNSLKRQDEAKAQAAKLIRNDYYIFPPRDTEPTQPDPKLPYNNLAISKLLAKLAFRSKKGIFVTHPSRFEVQYKNTVVYEFPKPMVALAATAVYAVLRDCAGENPGKKSNFAGEVYGKDYRRHLQILTTLLEKKPDNYHSSMSTLFTSAQSLATMVDDLKDGREQDEEIAALRIMGIQA